MMNNVNYEEVYDFVDKLRAKNISTIIEEANEQPLVIFYKIPNGFWTGIYICTNGELCKKEKYCGAMLVESSGAIDIGLFTINIKSNQTVKYLNSNDLDIYNEIFIDNAKHWYEVAKKYNICPQISNGYPDYNIEDDIKLKDMYMELYIKQHTAAGRKFIYN